MSDCLFTPSDTDEDYADAWFNWDYIRAVIALICFDYQLKTL